MPGQHHKMGPNAVIQRYLIKTECFSLTWVEDFPSIHSSFIRAENVKLPPWLYIMFCKYPASFLWRVYELILPVKC